MLSFLSKALYYLKAFVFLHFILYYPAYKWQGVLFSLLIATLFSECAYTFSLILYSAYFEY